MRLRLKKAQEAGNFDQVFNEIFRREQLSGLSKAEVREFSRSVHAWQARTGDCRAGESETFETSVPGILSDTRLEND
jgi:hypothetical protein